MPAAGWRCVHLVQLHVHHALGVEQRGCDVEHLVEVLGQGVREQPRLDRLLGGRCRDEPDRRARAGCEPQVDDADRPAPPVVDVHRDRDGVARPRRERQRRPDLDGAAEEVGDMSRTAFADGTGVVERTLVVIGSHHTGSRASRKPSGVNGLVMTKSVTAGVRLE